MTAELTKQVVVFRTGHLINFEWACGALKDAGIPYFTREETSGGLRLAMPVAPATEPGVSWTLLVPEASVASAQEVLSELPFEVRTEAGIWDFQPRPKVKAAWKIYTIIILVVCFVFAIVEMIKEWRSFR